MSRSATRSLAAIVVSGLMCGCATTPAPEGQAYSASYVGDRSRVSLDEIVVSLPLKGAAQPYQNLHVGLAATINPVRAGATSYGMYSVTDILQRLEARIGACLVESLAGMKEQSIDNLQELRGRIVWEAQSVVDEAMKHWQHGADYDVKVLVVSLYWTDASVGRAPVVRRGWW
ncbi:MAG: hypothetical protein U1F98_00360 [Verrucomicrobiota bacterium]